MQSKSTPSDHLGTRGAYPHAKPSSDQPRTEPASLVNAPLSAKGQFVQVKGWLCVHARGTTSCVYAASSSPLQTASISLSSCSCSPRCRRLCPPAPLQPRPSTAGEEGLQSQGVLGTSLTTSIPASGCVLLGRRLSCSLQEKKNNDNNKHDHDRSWYQ